MPRLKLGARALLAGVKAPPSPWRPVEGVRGVRPDPGVRPPEPAERPWEERGAPGERPAFCAVLAAVTASSSPLSARPPVPLGVRPSSADPGVPAIAAPAARPRARGFFPFFPPTFCLRAPG